MMLKYSNVVSRARIIFKWMRNQFIYFSYGFPFILRTRNSTPVAPKGREEVTVIVSAHTVQIIQQFNGYSGTCLSLFWFLKFHIH